MTRHIVIVGDSPLALLTALQLQQSLSKHAHIEITLVSREKEIVYLPNQDTLLGRISSLRISSVLSDIKIKVTTVKQINLHDKRVITANGIIDYDYLILDQTATYQLTEIKKIQSQLQRLIQEVKVKNNSGKSIKVRVTFSSSNLETWQLALLFATDVAKLSTSQRRMLNLETSVDKQPWLKEFFEQNLVLTKKTVGQTPGITIGAPTKPVNNRQIRGALLNHVDRFILDSYLSPDDHPELTVIEPDNNTQTNILRLNSLLAKQIVRNIELYLDGKVKKSIDSSSKSGILRSDDRSLIFVEGVRLNTLAKKILNKSETNIYKQLAGLL